MAKGRMAVGVGNGDGEESLPASVAARCHKCKAQCGASGRGEPISSGRQRTEARYRWRRASQAAGE
jgi:hypothetical protein